MAFALLEHAAGKAACARFCVRRPLRKVGEGIQSIAMSKLPGEDKRAAPTSAPPEALRRARDAYTGLKLIPWSEVWAAVAVAKLRGNNEMLTVFYEKMYREAVFDDRGVWSFESRIEQKDK